MTWDIDSQFLLGPAFLVSPVLERVSMEASDGGRIPAVRLGEKVEERGLSWWGRKTWFLILPVSLPLLLS